MKLQCSLMRKLGLLCSQAEVPILVTLPPAVASICNEGVLQGTLLCDRAEWHFRSSLDRYVWIHGMICAYMKPWAEGILVRIDNMAFRARIAMRGLLLAGQSRKATALRSGTQQLLSCCGTTQGLMLKWPHAQDRIAIRRP